MSATKEKLAKIEKDKKAYAAEAGYLYADAVCFTGEMKTKPEDFVFGEKGFALKEVFEKLKKENHRDLFLHGSWLLSSKGNFVASLFAGLKGCKTEQYILLSGFKKGVEAYMAEWKIVGKNYAGQPMYERLASEELSKT